MNQIELCHQVAEEMCISNYLAEKLVKCVFRNMRNTLENGEEISIRNFGKYQFKRYPKEFFCPFAKTRSCTSNKIELEFKPSNQMLSNIRNLIE